MTPTAELYEAIDAVPAGDWDAARSAGPSLFTDPDFLRATEAGLPAGARLFHAVVRDNGRPVGCSSFTSLPVDLGLLAGPRIGAAAGRVRRVVPGFGTLRVLVAGVPVSAGQNPLGLAPGADPGAVLGALDDLARSLARRVGARAIVYKEFTGAEPGIHEALQARGYSRGPVPPLYELDRPFPDLESYLAALTAHYRADIRRSLKKFAKAGGRTETLADPAAIRRAYTPAVHEFYNAVVARSEVVFEILPAAFFGALADRLPGRASLTCAYLGGELAGFNWGLLDGPEYHFLYCGINYPLNSGADLYFNVMYAQLDAAFRSGARVIHFGQTADAFKAKLGSVGKPRWVYAQGRGAVLRGVVRAAKGLLFPPWPAKPPHAVFKATAG